MFLPIFARLTKYPLISIFKTNLYFCNQLSSNVTKFPYVNVFWRTGPEFLINGVFRVAEEIKIALKAAEHVKMALKETPDV